MATIDRINSSTPVTGAEDPRRVREKDNTDGSAFSLDSGDREGVIYEPGTAPANETKTISQIREEIAREEAAAARSNLHSRFDGDSVIVELSNDGVRAAEKPASESIFDILKDTWRSIVGFFVSIWNGGDERTGEGSGTQGQSEPTDSRPGAEAAVDLTLRDSENEFRTLLSDPGDEISALSGETAPAPQPEPASARIPARGRERSNSPEDIAAFLVDYGGARLAKNSDLLTQYDRRGRIISVDPSEKRRILQGEGRIRRY